MIGTLKGKYFFGVLQDGSSEVHGVVVEGVGRDGMFLLVRYFDWETHDEEVRLTRVVPLYIVLDAGWRFFQTKRDLLDWLKKADGDTSRAAAA
jgi:hypothetical protein